MSIAIITGSSGLVGSETATFMHGKGMEIVGVDNNLRRVFFGEDGSTDWRAQALKKSLRNFTHCAIDIRDQEAIERLFRKYGRQITLVVHTAAQPSHDWAAREPFTDFSINATGTLVLLEATRRHCPDAVFIFISTNKVYGDIVNYLPLIEQQTRWELEPSHPYYAHGIDEQISLDQSRHSLFGVSKAAADLLTQEYGSYFGLRTGIFRAGCLTGGAHSGTELHGFLSYLVKCALAGKTYTVYGYKGKQVRDNLHSVDLVNAFWCFLQRPQSGVVYNIGGSRHCHCSVLEAISFVEEMCGRELKYEMSEKARAGDHIWWISDVRKFQRDYTEWSYQYDLSRIIEDIVQATRDRALHDA